MALTERVMYMCVYVSVYVCMHAWQQDEHLKHEDDVAMALTERVMYMCVYVPKYVCVHVCS